MATMRNVIKADIVALVIALVAPVAAQDPEAGREAYQRGDCAAAVREWCPLAEQGDALAQHDIGFMYENGFGLAQE
jgi:TPR repeat protein